MRYSPFLSVLVVIFREVSVLTISTTPSVTNFPSMSLQTPFMPVTCATAGRALSPTNSASNTTK